MSASASTTETASLRGLTTDEALRRLLSDGANELPSDRPRNVFATLREVLNEPMFLLLMAAAALYVVLGDIREALILTASMLIVIAITTLQQRRTERALAALRDLSSPRALVIRDGREQRIPGREVVVGDMVLLREGDRVPADGILRGATALSVDESILTGESLPVEKNPTTTADINISARVYSGSLVVRGFGCAEIDATGARSEIGKIGRALNTQETEATPLYRQIRRLVYWATGAALTLCTAVAVIYTIKRADWVGGVLAGITLAMGVLPEEFPVVLTVFLAMGAWRISRAGVLTRRIPALESIGAVTVLAVDKTGTLTENRMRVVMIETHHALLDLRGSAAMRLDDQAAVVLATALAACEREAFDPMERAIRDAANQHVPSHAASLNEMELVKEYDLTSALLAVTHVWRRPAANEFEVAVKGAPEAIMNLCGINNEARHAWLQRINAQTVNGLRVLAVARGVHRGGALPDSPVGFQLEWLGLVGLADPLRADVPKVLNECSQAGVRVIMITGDHPGTALAIATQAGLDTHAGVLTGADIEHMSDEELQRRARDVNIYARAKPEHKLQLVRAFKANGEVVAMTGDGVNDAPALRAAHVGVAMGNRGTDVAREAAALVLVNDDFNSLVQAVRLGRRIYDNIRHAMSYIVAVHIPLAGLGLLPVLFGWPLLFFPMHVLFLEFVIDPACAFVFEAERESSNIMRRKPRSPNEPLFTLAMLQHSVFLGLVILLLTVVIYGVALRQMDENDARALAFVAIVISNLALIFVSRSRSESFAMILTKPNRTYWWIAGSASTALVVTIAVPSIAEIFQFSAPPWAAVGTVIIAAMALVLASGLVFRRR